jgi:hypothetical protein
MTYVEIGHMLTDEEHATVTSAVANVNGIPLADDD